MRKVQWSTLLTRPIRVSDEYLARSALHEGSLYLIGSSVINGAAGFLFWIVGARLYSPREVGLAAAIVSVAGLLSTLSLGGLDFALVRFLPHTIASSTMIGSAVTLGGSVAILLSLLFVQGLGIWSPALLDFRHDRLVLCSLVAATVSATVAALLSSVYLSRKRADLVLHQSLAFGTSRVVLAVGFGAIGYSMGLVAAWALAFLATIGVSLFLFLPRVEGVGFHICPRIDLHSLSHVARFAITNYLSAFLWSAPALLLPLLVINVAGPEANAYFYVATSIAGLLAMVPVGVSMSLFAQGSRDENDLRRNTLAGARLIFLLLAPAVLIALFLAGRVLQLFGRSYSEQGTILVWILSLSTFPLAVNQLFIGVRRVQKRMGSVVAASGAVLVVTMVLSSTLIFRMGLVGVGMGWFAAQALVAALVLTKYKAGL